MSLQVIWSRLNVGKQGCTHRVNDGTEVLDQALNRLLRILQVLTRRSNLDLAKLHPHIDSRINQLLDCLRAREVSLERIKYKTHLEPAVAFTIESPVLALDDALLKSRTVVLFLPFWCQVSDVRFNIKDPIDLDRSVAEPSDIARTNWNRYLNSR